jgi:uncharacterized membrane protein (UPF0127 family)
MKNSALLLLALACTQPAAPPPSAPATTTQAQTQSTSSATPHVIFPDGYSVAVEIASDDDTRTQGLMYRDRLPEDRGMIFLFPQTGEYPFWMKNTLIPLDMIWIDESHRIGHIAHDVPPCKADPCPSYPPNAPAKYVLETAAGVTAKHHLKDGDTLRFEGLEHVIIR